MAVTDKAILKIKEMIVSGELRAGSRLPKEADLAARLGLSRSSLREAVRALTMLHILDVRQGDGTYVTSLEPTLLLDALSFVVDFHRDESVFDFFEVRRILEPAAAALAATRMTAEDLAELGGILDDTDPSDPLDVLVEKDMAFHRKIAAGASNTVLVSLIDGLSGPTQRTRIWRDFTKEHSVERILSEHRAIYDALTAGEPELARSWATVHISGVEHWLREAHSADTLTVTAQARQPE